MEKTLNKFENKSKNLPIEQYNIRGVKVAVWEHEKDGNKYRQLTLKKTYKDDKGEFHDTDSFSASDLAPLIVALEEVQRKEFLGEYRHNE